MAEIARVLAPGGRLAFSVTHPTRWMFPDDPGPDGLTATQSYWDRRPYVEVDDATGVVAYVEHHRTIGDWVRVLHRHGLSLVDIAEPEWPEDHHRVWGAGPHPRTAHPGDRRVRRGASYVTRPQPGAWVADPGVLWSILLTARLVELVPPQLLDERLRRLYAEHAWAEPPAVLEDSAVVPLQQRLAGAAAESVPVAVGLSGNSLVIAAHHSRVDGLGLLGVLAGLLDAPLRSSARGVSDRATPGRVRAIGARLAEVAFAPPARVRPAGPSPWPGQDTFAMLTLPGSFRTADLVHAGVAGVTAYNGRHGGAERRVAVAVGASRRGGDDLVVADRSALIRLRGLEGVTRDEIGRRLREAPLQPAAPAARAVGGVVSLGLRLLAPRLGSTLLVSHLGDVTASGVAGLAFAPVTGGGSGVSLGAVGHDGATTLTLRARGRTHDADGLAELLEAIGVAATSG